MARELFHGGTSVGGSSYLYLRVASGTVVAVVTMLDRWTDPGTISLVLSPTGPNRSEPLSRGRTTPVATDGAARPR
jgi:hypothetical protein